MAKVVVIVTSILEAAKFYEGQLKELFGDIIDLTCISEGKITFDYLPLNLLNSTKGTKKLNDYK